MKLTKILIAHINGVGYFLGKSIFKALTSTAKDKAEIGRALNHREIPDMPYETSTNPETFLRVFRYFL